MDKNDQDSARAKIQRIRDEAEIVAEYLRVGPIDIAELRKARESFYRDMCAECYQALCDEQGVTGVPSSTSGGAE